MHQASIIEMVAERVCSCLWITLWLEQEIKQDDFRRFEELAELILPIVEPCKNGENGKGY